MQFYKNIYVYIVINILDAIDFIKTFNKFTKINIFLKNYLNQLKIAIVLVYALKYFFLLSRINTEKLINKINTQKVLHVELVSVLSTLCECEKIYHILSYIYIFFFLQLNCHKRVLRLKVFFILFHQL